MNSYNKYVRIMYVDIAFAIIVADITIYTERGSFTF